METRRDVFQAIADPTRRDIIGLLSQEPMNVNAIAGHFEMTRQAVSLHVKILAECGLISIRREGRERYCDPQFDGLEAISGWVEQYKRFWESHLDSLEAYLNKIQKTKKHANNKRKHR